MGGGFWEAGVNFYFFLNIFLVFFNFVIKFIIVFKNGLKYVHYKLILKNIPGTNMNSKGRILLKEARNSGTLWGQTGHSITQQVRIYLLHKLGKFPEGLLTP